ncbi:MAG: VTT domain-containing protein [Candidatus Peribacteraceae bacterium]|nr:VTT domain-containing protein [Candidatus Peribacteraceae bacterium]
MIRLLKQHWPLLLAALIVVASAWLSHTHAAALQSLFLGYGVLAGVGLFLLCGVLLTLVPGATTLPLIPIGVALWGWPATVALMLAVWLLGGQILFELVRLLKRTRFARWLQFSHAHSVRALVEEKTLLQAVLLRLVVEGDVLSYAFGLFSTMGSLEFFRHSLVATLPAAVVYTVVGSLPLLIQLSVVVLAAAAFAACRWGPGWVAALRQRPQEALISL